MTRKMSDGGALAGAPAVEKISATAKQLDRDHGTAPPAPVVDLVAHRALRLALDHLDAAGLCACWTAAPTRRCRGRWSA